MAESSAAQVGHACRHCFRPALFSLKILGGVFNLVMIQFGKIAFEVHVYTIIAVPVTHIKVITLFQSSYTLIDSGSEQLSVVY